MRTGIAVDVVRRERVVVEITSMMRDRRFDGLISRLNRRFPGHRQLTEDAACEAVARVLERIEHADVSNVGAYMYQVAANYVKKTLTQVGARETSLQWADGVDSGLEPQAQLPWDQTPGGFDAAIGTELLIALKQVTAGWNDNIRVVTNLVLEHAFKDDYDWMTAEDLAQEASAILGEEISAQSASMWKSRGLRRLRGHFNFD